jgi:hypothetical protein
VSQIAERRPRRHALLLVLATLPLLAVPVVGFFAFSGDDGGGEPAIAVGALGGGFHPVAGSFVADDTHLAACADDEYLCLEQGFGNLAYRQGPKRALALFEERIVTDSGVKTDCHRIAHSIGSASFALFDGNVGKTFAVGSATCASGYYHGILERAFVGVTTKSQLEKVAASLCDGQGIRRRSFLDYQCRHGLGHGLMIQTGYDLPMALSVCGRLATRWDHVVCTSGVFMENINTRYGFRSQWVKDDDPLYPCATVKVLDRRSCYVRSTTRILELNGSDFANAAATCASVGLRWSRYCFRGYGRDAVGEARYAPAKILSLCRLAGAGEGDCLYGAARTVGDGFGYQGALRAAALCQRAPDARRDACFAGVGLVLGLLYPTDAKRRSACAAVAGRNVEPCAAAAMAEVDPNARESWG